MALRPLADNPQHANGTPLNGGLTPRAATNYIENLLDDDGHTADHVDADSGVLSNRELSDDMPDNRQRVETDATLENTDIDDTGDTDTPEGDDDNVDKVDADQPQADDENADTGSIQTLNELADALDMSLDDLKGAITHTFNAAGKEHTVTLADLESGYQIRADYDRNKGQLAEQRKAFEQEQQARVDSFKQQANALAHNFQMMEAMIRQDYESPAMQQLRESDPAEWTARIHEGNGKLQQLANARQQAAAEYDRLMHDEQIQCLAREGKTLIQDVEGWGDDKLKTAVDTIKTLGFDDQEVVGIADARLIKGALELSALRSEVSHLKAQIGKADTVVNKVKKTIPKTIKSGKARGKQALDRANVGQLKKRLAKSHKVKDAAAVIESLME